MDTTHPDAQDTIATLTSGPQSRLDSIQHLLHRYPVISPFVVLLVSAAVFVTLGNGRFQRPETLGIILQQTAVLATLAIGQTLVILTAGIDLAVGTGMLLTHIVIAKLAADMGVPPFLALLIGAIVGLSLGAFHGFMVTKVNLPPFIVTLGTFYIFNSLALVYSRAQTISKEAMGGEDTLLLWTGKCIQIGTMQDHGRRGPCPLAVCPVRLCPVQHLVGESRVCDGRRRRGGSPGRYQHPAVCS